MSEAAYKKSSGYDGLAWFYERHWGREYHAQIMPVLENILFKRLGTGAYILDLCCGTGHLSRLLACKGFKVAGADISFEMLKIAKCASPEISFFVADAASYSALPVFDAVISAFESVNHMAGEGELASFIRNASFSLKDGGLFAFDFLEEKAYAENWRKAGSIVEDDNVCVIKGGYDSAKALAKAELTLFRFAGKWERSDISIFERYYPAEVIEREVLKNGFAEVRIYRAGMDFNMSGDLGTGRAFALARKATDDSLQKNRRGKSRG